MATTKQVRAAKQNVQKAQAGSQAQAHDREPSGEHATGARQAGGARTCARRRGRPRARGPQPGAALRDRQEGRHPGPLADGQVGPDQGDSQDALTKTILITGATDGLGRALAGELVADGATVLVHGRDDARGQETLEAIRGSTHWYRADLASLEEVRELAARVESENDRLDVLVNNAGIGTTGERAESRDGYELRFAVNYLAGFLLTRLLVPLLVRSAPARVVNVSSAGQADRLRRRDARAALRRGTGLRAEQARTGDVHVRPGARAT